MKAPWHDFAGNEIHNGDVIIHPSGEEGVVVIVDPALVHCECEYDEWCVDYGHGILSRLCLQIGDKGMAIVMPSEDNG